MWSDNETSDDLFGFRVHADLIRELIMDPAVLPATIGVYGDWGGGKSSIMQMLRDDFENAHLMLHGLRLRKTTRRLFCRFQVGQ